MGEVVGFPTPRSELLTKEEAARLLGVSGRTLQRYVEQGLPALRFTSKTVRFKRQDLMAWRSPKHRLEQTGS